MSSRSYATFPISLSQPVRSVPPEAYKASTTYDHCFQSAAYFVKESHIRLLAFISFSIGLLHFSLGRPVSAWRLPMRQGTFRTRTTDIAITGSLAVLLMIVCLFLWRSSSLMIVFGQNIHCLLFWKVSSLCAIPTVGFHYSELLERTLRRLLLWSLSFVFSLR